MTRPAWIEGAEQLLLDLATARELATQDPDVLREIARRDPEAWDALGYRLGEMIDAVSAVAQTVRNAGEKWHAARPSREVLQ